MAGFDALASPAFYEIILEGRLDSRWTAWFEGIHLEALPDGRVCLSGIINDQPALHGILERIRDLNLVIVSVTRA